jgi:hypothetical protein
MGKKELTHSHIKSAIPALRFGRSSKHRPIKREEERNDG